MRIALIVLSTLIVLAIASCAAALMWDEPKPPPVLTSVADALDAVDFGDLPPQQRFVARDGTGLLFHSYPGTGADTVVLIHGATFTSASMHAVARAMHARGATVYALSIRGHDGTGRSGDIDYVGQLDDDLEDFMKTLAPKQGGERRALLGFSAGGEFVLAFAGKPRAALFDRFVLVAPALFYKAPTARPGFGGFVSTAGLRTLVLFTLAGFGVDRFERLPVIAYAVAPGSKHSKTPTYSLRMARNFGGDEDYLDDLRRAPGPVALVAGANDEIFLADQYAPTLQPARPDLDVTIMPGLSHMDMIVRPEALEVLADKALGKAPQS